MDSLKHLWEIGLSASQIATRLGGVTRNAVIGKVHRLGLPMRKATARSRLPKPKKRLDLFRPTRMLNQLRPKLKGEKVLFNPQWAKPHGRTQVAVIAEVTRAVALELNVPPPLRIDIWELKENSCRWPYGDPKDEGFHFCGRPKADLVSYCPHHCKLAFAPAARRK